MADLQVDDQVLADSERRLNRLHTVFGHLDDQKDDLHAIWGAPAVTAAIGGFFDNWSHYRKKLLTTIEAVGGMVTDARKVFHEADGKLAKGLTGQGHTHGGSKAGHR